jgi:hypothetical protein
MAAVSAYIPLLALAAVLVVIAARKIGRIPVRIWQAMTGGALLVLLTGAITPAGALRAIEPDVMVFLVRDVRAGRGAGGKRRPLCHGLRHAGYALYLRNFI